MKPAARSLAEFVTSLEYSQIPPHVVEKAKACIIDTIAASTYGAQLPWSKMIIGYAQRNVLHTIAVARDMDGDWGAWVGKERRAA